ncbi:MAG: hypothetical protein HC781_21310 [Leptolyngbyaceae cyanobacterium CSU_1_4]|nr:hypothetical protein [Leptolyngbyaceae cyanobacterium CSU_1_4]
MLKPITLLFSLVLSMLLSLPIAASCRTLNQQAICIVDIQRSAKNYWQYRVSISIDGIKTPAAFYNCRDRYILQKDGTQVKFEPDGIGDFICRLYKPPQKTPLQIPSPIRQPPLK